MRQNLDRKVSISIRYRLDSTRFESRWGEILFFLKIVHTSSRAHLATY